METDFLPRSLTKEKLAVWITDNAKDTYSDMQKDYFTEEELVDMKDDSYKLGQKIHVLNDLRAEIVERLTKGTDEDYEVVISPNIGIKILTANRESKDRLIARGYEEYATEVYGIPADDGYMHFVDIEGKPFNDRKRKLSARENDQFNSGMFSNDYKMSITN